jgi:3'(2'), 5'-bisphosphate nucleotidase
LAISVDETGENPIKTQKMDVSPMATETNSFGVWGGEHCDDARLAARLVGNAVQLCLEYRNQRASPSDTSKKPDATTATLDKIDGTPVTALDFAIQGYIVASLKQYEEERCHDENRKSVSFLGEEDATDLRNESNRGLAQSALHLARSLDPNLTMEKFLDALDDHGKDGKDGHCEKSKMIHQQSPHRDWILDPIDGTKGLLTGKQYAIGLALCLYGKVVVGAIGNPSALPASSRVMIAVKGKGLRYYHGKEIVSNPPRNIPGSWHTQEYDLDSLDTISSSSPPNHPKQASVDYPPYLVSMGPKLVSTSSNSSSLPRKPQPFGPRCPPAELCCGSLVKYHAVASGKAAGFLQLSPSGLVNSWDHAPGMLCVEESGGGVLVVEKYFDDASTTSSSSLPLFDRPKFQIHHGIVIFARETSGEIRQRFIDSVLDT